MIKILALAKLKAFANNKFYVDKLLFLSVTLRKTLQEKEKMLVTSIFSFSYSVSKSCYKIVKTQDCVVKSVK